MAREIPEVVRAAAGLAATVLDEARKLPETLPALPVRVLGLAMQHAMKVQQQYAGLVARGDELFTGLRGEDEPGLATFDDDPPPSTGFRESAFDRAGHPAASTVDEPVDEPIDDPVVQELPTDPAADAVTAVVDELADQVETGQQSIETIAEKAPAIEEILDEMAIDELVDQAPTLDETTPATPGLAVADDAPATEDARAVENALLESDDSPAAGAEPTADVATTVDVLDPDGGITTVDGAVTDEGIAAPEKPAAKPRKAAKGTGSKNKDSKNKNTETAATGTNAGPATATDESGSDVAAATGVRTDVGSSDTRSEDGAIAEGAAVDAVGDAAAAPTDDPQGASEVSGSQAAGTAPVDGYDSFSIAQLRGRLRGYTLGTVDDLLRYEESTRAREPYLRLLRNRLEKLEQQAVESSPLAPRGA